MVDVHGVWCVLLISSLFYSFTERNALKFYRESLNSSWRVICLILPLGDQAGEFSVLTSYLHRFHKCKRYVIIVRRQTITPHYLSIYCGTNFFLKCYSSRALKIDFDFYNFRQSVQVLLYLKKWIRCPTCLCPAAYIPINQFWDTSRWVYVFIKIW